MADTITIPEPNIQTMIVKIKGTKPLIYNKWSSKAIQMIKDKQGKKAVKAREVRNAEAEVENSYYKNSSGEIAFPAGGLKKAIVSSARNLPDVKMALLRGAIFIVADDDDLVPVKYKKKVGREDMVRIGMGVSDIRYRGQVEGWTMDFPVKFNADILSPAQILNLVQIAGFSCGLGEWRPEKSGNFGTFELNMSS